MCSIKGSMAMRKGLPVSSRVYLNAHPILNPIAMIVELAVVIMLLASSSQQQFHITHGDIMIYYLEPISDAGPQASHHMQA